jgi:hypothetical protein
MTTTPSRKRRKTEQPATQEKRTRTLIALFEALPPEQQTSVILFAEFLAESVKKT